MRMLSTLFALAVVSASSTPCVARDWASAGGWDIAESGNDACIMAMEYAGEGDTIFAVSLDINGNVIGFATNTAWSAKKDEKYDLSYELDDSVYSGVKSIGVGDYTRRGFAVAFRSEFLGDFTKSSGLRIKMGETIVDDLKLTGSAAGLQRLRQCVAHVKGVATAAAREKARFNHITKDPFAASPPQGSSAVSVQARSPANLPSLFSDEDYPSSALRNREEGLVGYKLEIGANGRVTNCTITRSSSSAALDAATCRLLRSRARFTPAVDAQGRPTTSEIAESKTWSLPKGG